MDKVYYEKIGTPGLPDREYFWIWENGHKKFLSAEDALNLGREIVGRAITPEDEGPFVHVGTFGPYTVPAKDDVTISNLVKVPSMNDDSIDWSRPIAEWTDAQLKHFSVGSAALFANEILRLRRELLKAECRADDHW